MGRRERPPRGGVQSATVFWFFFVSGVYFPVCKDGAYLQQVPPILSPFHSSAAQKKSLLMRPSTDQLRSVATQSPRGVKVPKTTRTVISFFLSPWQSRRSGCHLFHRGGRSMPQQFSRKKEFNGQFNSMVNSRESGEALDLFFLQLGPLSFGSQC